MTHDPTITVRGPDLAKEIQEGTLRLRGDLPLMGRAFSFSVGEYPIGLYAIVATGPGRLILVRAWNKSKQVRDPISGLWVENTGRQFGKLHRNTPMFLVEYTSDVVLPVAKVAFKAGEIHLGDLGVPGMPAALQFESALLTHFTFLG